MKTLISSTLLVALCLFGYPTTATAACAFPSTTESSLICRLNRGLPQAVWQVQGPNSSASSLHFYDSGQVYWFKGSNGTLTDINIFDWEIIVGQFGQPMLRFTNASGQHLFEIETACNEIGLIQQQSGAELLLQKVDAMPEQLHARQKQNISGQWGNTLNPLQVKVAAQKEAVNAYLKYDFSPDGKFVRYLGNEKMSIKSTGNWMLAKDGKHLILQFDDGKVALSKLKYLSMDEMVLEHTLQSPNEHFITNRKDFFFNRS